MKQQIANISASLADLGLILPLTLGLALGASMDLGALLMGLGMFALASGVIYRRPIPAQPMKVVAAMAIVGQLEPSVIQATGILIGLSLIILAVTGWAGLLRRFVYPPVLSGIQVALGVKLFFTALPMIESTWLPVLSLLFVFIFLKATRLHPFAFILVVCLSLIMFWQAPLTSFSAKPMAITIPHFSWPSIDAFIDSLQLVYFPQMALTLSNALLLVAVLAQSYFPEDKERLSENRLALSSGIINLILAPFGAMPMCHGAGGLVAYHTAGGRNGLPLITLGLILLILGAFSGPAAVEYLQMIPQASFGLLLLITASYMVDAKKLLQSKTDERMIILIVVLIGAFYSMLAGLTAGMIGVWLYKKFRQQPSSLN